MRIRSILWGLAIGAAGWLLLGTLLVVLAGAARADTLLPQDRDYCDQTIRMHALYAHCMTFKAKCGVAPHYQDTVEMTKVLVRYRVAGSEPITVDDAQELVAEAPEHELATRYEFADEMARRCRVHYGMSNRP